MAREYADTIVVSYSSLKKIQRAQKDIYKTGVLDLDEGTLANVLGASATILGLAFVASTPAGVAAGVVSLFATMLSGSEADMVGDMIKTGYMEMGDMLDYFDDNSYIDRMEIKFPFIEYNVNGENIRFVTGKGVIGRVHSGSGWMEP